MSNKSTVTFEDLNDDNYLKNIASRDLQTCEITRGLPGFGYLSKELINKMIITMRRSGQTLTSLYLSPEDTADMVDWERTFDPETEREIFEGNINSNISTYTRYRLKEGKVYGFNFVNGVADINSICVGIIDRS